MDNQKFPKASPVANLKQSLANTINNDEKRKAITFVIGVLTAIFTVLSGAIAFFISPAWKHGGESESNKISEDAVIECRELAGNKYDLPKSIYFVPRKVTNIDFRQAIPVCQRALKLNPNDSQVMTQLARALYASNDSDNLAAARELYMEAAKKGNASAQNNLATLYESGRSGLLKDETKAAALYMQAAEQGNNEAQANLAQLFKDGRGGLPKDEAKAAALYKQAADGGNVWAQAKLGMFYEYGLGGLLTDEAKAAAFYNQAADGGDAWAQAELGAFYERGRGGLPKDEIRAVELYKRAAKQENAFAIDALKRLNKN